MRKVCYGVFGVGVLLGIAGMIVGSFRYLRYSLTDALVCFLLCFGGYLLLSVPLLFPAVLGRKKDYWQVLGYPILFEFLFVSSFLLFNRSVSQSGMEALGPFITLIWASCLTPVIFLNFTALCSYCSSKTARLLIPVLFFLIHVFFWFQIVNNFTGELKFHYGVFILLECLLTVAEMFFMLWKCLRISFQKTEAVR